MHDQFQQLRELLTPNGNWTKGAAARDQDGNILNTGNHPRSICYCLLGGIERVCPGSVEDRVQMRDEIRYSIQSRHQNRRQGKLTAGAFIADFNDDPETSHDDVLALIDYTLERIAA